jgi:hypothetical protein
MHLDVKFQTVCQFWAQAFNRCKPPKQISFLKPRVMTIDGVSYFVEEFFDGTHQKFNNNGMFVRLGFFKSMITPQAFSLWTYKKSGGKLCVLDIQGFALDNLHVFNDSAMVSDLNLGLTDSGPLAMAQFLHMHQMSTLDKFLGISDDAEHLVGSGQTKVMKQMRCPST